MVLAVSFALPYWLWYLGTYAYRFLYSDLYIDRATLCHIRNTIDVNNSTSERCCTLFGEWARSTSMRRFLYYKNNR